MAFLVATTSLPAVYRPNGYARTTTVGTPHARANFRRHPDAMESLDLYKYWDCCPTKIEDFKHNLKDKNESKIDEADDLKENYHFIWFVLH